ncbi:MAG: Two component, sigma54 specific, transcriptional regulator, Fis family [Pedosphaera sp.]|nr:Two component, sigma54 specific, transcriptional regulator, Fis family [Pedosphaera sp.]
MRANILVIDDDAEIRELLVQVLQRSNYQVSQVKDGASLKEAINRLQPEIVLLDYKLPDATGLDLLPIIKKEWPEAEVIMLTGHATYEVAVEAIKRGAFHFQEKPFDPESLLNLIKRALEIRSLREAVSTASAIFQCEIMKAVVRTVRRVAASDVSILITGESGTGKEVIADLIHTSSARASGPLIKINCAALPRELIESELFGSVKGAFTGANSDREGLFRQAEGGTLLLDELSEMPIDTQSKLLRVLQEKEVRPVGGRVSYKTDCRIIAATNRKPDEAIKDGKLREDLFYRISAVSVHLPPLRERREDILPLATAFLKRFSAQANRDIGGFTNEASERLRTFDWPGNVRQLQNEVQRAVLLSEGKMVDAPDLSITTATTEITGDTSYTLLEGVERNTIVQMLKETGGNKLETAKRLGIGRQTLYNKIKAYGIDM